MAWSHCQSKSASRATGWNTVHCVHICANSRCMFITINCCVVLSYRSCRLAPLIQCDYCPLLFHMDCLDPPLTALPAGKWMCPNHVEHLVVRSLFTGLDRDTSGSGFPTLKFFPCCPVESEEPQPDQALSAL